MIRTKKPKKQGAGRHVVTAAIVLVFLGGGYGVYRLVNDDATPRKRVMETIALRLVPPPPPPPPKEEPPPPPPKIVEQEIEPPPTEMPEEAPQDEAPPQGPIALDAQGQGAGDAFGLAARPGGTPLRLGGGTGGGGGGLGAGFGRYASLMQDQIGRRLRDDDKLNTNRFRATIKVWLTAAGRVDKVEILRTTGDTQLDTLIEQAIGTMPALPEAPPPSMPQPVIVRVGALPGVG